MSRPLKRRRLTDDEKKLLLEVATTRARTPSDKELARELGLTPYSIWARMKRLKSAVSSAAHKCTLMSDVSTSNNLASGRTEVP
jgi:hypothetical protein